MNKIKCFFGVHKWMSVARVNGKAHMSSVFMGDMGKQDIRLCVDRCIHCGNEKAYMSSYAGDQTVGLEYAKGVLGIK